jgi:hypothetical protein
VQGVFWWLRVLPPREKGGEVVTESVTPHLLVVLLQTLVILAEGGQVDERYHVLEAVNPLLTFRFLAPDIHDPTGKQAHSLSEGRCNWNPTQGHPRP